MDNETKFPVTSLTRGDIIEFFKIRFKCSKRRAKVIKKAEELSEAEMKHLASRMENDYFDSMFWSSLEYHFDTCFLTKKQ